MKKILFSLLTLPISQVFSMDTYLSGEKEFENFLSVSAAYQGMPNDGYIEMPSADNIAKEYIDYFKLGDKDESTNLEKCRKDIEIIKNIFNPSTIKGKKVLEVGSQLGYHAQIFGEFGANISVVECMGPHLRYSIMKGRVLEKNAYNAFVQYLPLELNGTFDIVVAHSYCVDVDYRHLVTKRMADLIKDDGFVIIGFMQTEMQCLQWDTTLGTEEAGLTLDKHIRTRNISVNDKGEFQEEVILQGASQADLLIFKKTL